MKKLSNQQLIRQEISYIAFLEKRINSKNYQSKVSKEVIEKDKDKLKKAALKLRLLQGKF